MEDPYDDGKPLPSDRLDGPIDDDEQLPITTLGECVYDILKYVVPIGGFVGLYVWLAQNVTGIYGAGLVFMLGVGVTTNALILFWSDRKLYAEYRDRGFEVEGDIVGRSVELQRESPARAGRSSGVSKTTTVHSVKVMYQAPVPVGYIQRDGVVVEDSNVDVVVTKEYKVHRDIYYDPSNSITLWYRPEEPKSAVPRVFLEPELRGSRLPHIFCGFVITLIPTLIIANRDVWEKRDSIATTINIFFACIVLAVVYQRTHREHEDTRKGKDGKIRAWLPSGEVMEVPSCPVPEDGAHD